MKKNKLLAVFLALAMTLTLLPTAALAVEGVTGTGTEADPYLVSSDTELIAAVAAGGYIKLNSDIEYTTAKCLHFTDDVTLDLNGHSISAVANGSCKAGGTKVVETHFLRVENGGNLTIQDSSDAKTGSITASYGGNSNLSVVRLKSGGALTVEGGKIQNAAGAATNYGSAAVYVESGATFNLKGGIIHGADARFAAYPVKNVGTMTMSGGAITSDDPSAPGITQSGTLIMTDGDITGISRADGIATDTSTKSTTISGGTFKGAPKSTWIAEGKVAVFDGTTTTIATSAPEAFTASVNGKVFYTGANGADDALYGAAKGDEITFRSTPTKATKTPFSLTHTLKVTLENGATFDPALITPPTNCHAVSTAVDGNTTTYTVVVDETKAEAKIGETYYNTLGNANVAAVDGDTITVLKDINAGTSYYTISKKLTLDLNGHVIDTQKYYASDKSQYGAIMFNGAGKTLTIIDSSNDGTGAIINTAASTKYGYALVAKNGTVKIEAGTYSGTATAGALYAASSGTLTITGGTFSSDPATYVAEGYAAAEAEGVWTVTKKTYTVTFESNGGSAVSNATVNHGATVSAPDPAPTKDGYNFIGWCTDSELTTAYDFSTAVTSNITLYANWSAKPVYTVTFNTDGGSEVNTQNVVSGAQAIEPTAPTKAGYTFGGWFVGDVEYDFTTPVTGNVTLTAHWTLNTYTVTFNSNGGSAVAAIENVAHGTAVSAPTAPTRSGYTFAGWQLNSSDYEFSTPVTENITLIAKWTEIPSTPSDSDSSDDDRDFTTPSQPTTSTETKPDGSTTTTESKPDGTVTESNTSKPVTDASGNTSQTTTETSTGKDGVTESKTETVTKADGSASSTTESTTTKPDGTTTESKTETSINADGSTASTTTETTTNKDGTVTESKTEATTSTVTNKDGSTTETKQETTTTSTGSKTESTTVTTVNKDGSSTATTTATTTDKAGTVTESKTESTTNKNGTTTEKTTTTETKANGTVTESKTETTINKDGSSKATTTETVTKADGTKVESKTTATTSLSTNKATGTVTETKKETTTTSDGVKSEGTTVTQIQKDGTVTSTETVKASDSTGTTATKTTTLDAKGEVTTTAEATVSAKAVTEATKTGAAVTLPVEVPTAKTTEAAPTVQVTMPKSDSSVKVEIPVENVTPGTVAVIVNADGTEKIVSASVVTENGVALTLDGSATVKLVDNAKSFVDVPETNVFYNEISSLSARNIMIGVSNEKFDLINGVTLNQVANVAGRITGEVDVNDFNAGIVWGNENGLRTGNNAATRGEVLKALYIAAGSPAVEDTSILSRFKDASSIPADLAAIAAWAAQNGILKGNMDGTAALGANVTRGQACALAGRTMGALA